MDIKDIRAIGKKPRKPKAQKPEFMPSRERIARMTAKFREQKLRRLNKEFPPVDDDCDAELEVEADEACR